MIPLVVIGCSSFKGFSGCSGSPNVPIDVSVISSFEKRENPKEPEKPEKPLSQQKLSQILLNLTALPMPCYMRQGGNGLRCYTLNDISQTMLLP